MKETEKRFYRASEVAEYIGVCVATVWNYAKEGKITPKKVSNRVTVFDIDEVKQALLGGAL